MFKFVVIFFLHKFHPKFTEKFLDKIVCIVFPALGYLHSFLSTSSAIKIK